MAAASSSAQQQSGPGWFVEVTGQPLDAAKYMALVTAPGAGAISSFVGTTRDSFQGRRVLRLEYEAYVPMALAKLKVRRWRPASSSSSCRRPPAVAAAAGGSRGATCGGG